MRQNARYCIFLLQQLEYSMFRRLLTTSTAKAALTDFTHLKGRKPSNQELCIVPEFLTPQLEEFLDRVSVRKLKRLARGPYSEGHFDGVIKGYKEASISSWGSSIVYDVGTTVVGSVPEQPPAIDLADESDENVGTVIRWVERSVNSLLVGGESGTGSSHLVSRWLPPHILELRTGDSGIGAHVDHKEAFGDVIAGVCLASDAVMKFVHVGDSSSHFSALLPRRCLYFQRGFVRHDFTHEIPLDPNEHVFRGRPIERTRRISLMIRDLRQVQ
ncbi:hypothetical protein BDR26DRAFT_857289 [Obelidium mucronatum]|nr:hypothetical protein BDR26DRAFT_857289 [Obelidium mucronatum]